MSHAQPRRATRPRKQKDTRQVTQNDNLLDKEEFTQRDSCKKTFKAGSRSYDLQMQYTPRSDDISIDEGS